MVSNSNGVFRRQIVDLSPAALNCGHEDENHKYRTGNIKKMLICLRLPKKNLRVQFVIKSSLTNATYVYETRQACVLICLLILFVISGICRRGVCLMKVKERAMV